MGGGGDIVKSYNHHVVTLTSVAKQTMWIVKIYDRFIANDDGASKNISKIKDVIAVFLNLRFLSTGFV